MVLADVRIHHETASLGRQPACDRGLHFVLLHVEPANPSTSGFTGKAVLGGEDSNSCHDPFPPSR